MKEIRCVFEQSQVDGLSLTLRLECPESNFSVPRLARNPSHHTSSAVHPAPMKARLCARARAIARYAVLGRKRRRSEAATSSSSATHPLEEEEEDEDGGVCRK